MRLCTWYCCLYDTENRMGCLICKYCALSSRSLLLFLSPLYMNGIYPVFNDTFCACGEIPFSSAGALWFLNGTKPMWGAGHWLNGRWSVSVIIPPPSMLSVTRSYTARFCPSDSAAAPSVERRRIAKISSHSHNPYDWRMVLFFFVYLNKWLMDCWTFWLMFFIFIFLAA